MVLGVEQDCLDPPVTARGGNKGRPRQSDSKTSRSSQAGFEVFGNWVKSQIELGGTINGFCERYGYVYARVNQWCRAINLPAADVVEDLAEDLSAWTEGKVTTSEVLRLIKAARVAHKKLRKSSGK